MGGAAWTALITGACIGSGLGCTTTNITYTDPLYPERVVAIERNTFLRQGSFEVEAADGTWLRIKDDPLSQQMAWLLAGLGCIGGAIAGLPLGAAGSVIGCLGVGAAGAGLAPEEPKVVVEEAPAIARPSEMAPTSMYKIAPYQWHEFRCGGALEPDYCLPR